VKAIVCDGYGAPDQVLRFGDVDDPDGDDDPAVGDDRALVRVRAASVNAADWHIVRGEPYLARLSFGLRKPKIRVPGCDVAGPVESVGPGVTTLKPGDEVYGSAFMRGLGAFAEWAAVPEDVLAPKPANLTFEQAAAVPLAALTALQGLRDHGRVQPGQRVLIIGAAGGVGSFAVQLAKWLGAEVTGVCSTRNLELVRSLGADAVVDYTKDDLDAAAGHPYDVVFQVSGTRSPSRCRRLLTRAGTLVYISGDTDGGRVIGPMSRLIAGLAQSPFVSQTLRNYTVKPTKADLQALTDLVEAGKVTPVIDRTYALREVPQALLYLETGHARGKTVITT
jgi:NADPH:quinone reductase-like Zn-dependent oxidoreductase